MNWVFFCSFVWRYTWDGIGKSKVPGGIGMDLEYWILLHSPLVGVFRAWRYMDMEWEHSTAERAQFLMHRLR